MLVILFENSELNKALERPVHNLKDAYFETIAAGICHGETTNGPGIKSIGYPGDPFQTGISDGE